MGTKFSLNPEMSPQNVYGLFNFIKNLKGHYAAGQEALAATRGEEAAAAAGLDLQNIIIKCTTPDGVNAEKLAKIVDFQKQDFFNKLEIYKQGQRFNPKLTHIFSFKFKNKRDNNPKVTANFAVPAAGKNNIKAKAAQIALAKDTQFDNRNAHFLRLRDVKEIPEDVKFPVVINVTYKPTSINESNYYKDFASILKSYIK